MYDVLPTRVFVRLSLALFEKPKSVSLSSGKLPSTTKVFSSLRSQNNSVRVQPSYNIPSRVLHVYPLTHNFPAVIPFFQGAVLQLSNPLYCYKCTVQPASPLQSFHSPPIVPNNIFFCHPLVMALGIEMTSSCPCVSKCYC
jgi:hypothetical protein